MPACAPAAVAAPGVRPVMRTPRSLDIDITSRCNLRCAYCYFFDDSARTYTDLPSDEWLRFFDECGRLGVMRLTIAGGEPFIRSDLPALLASVVSNRMRFTILSNGSLITPSLARMLRDTGRCDDVQVSLDGPRSEVHDTCRGNGAFDGAVRGIRTLIEHGVPVSSRVTIQRHNVAALEETVRFLLDTLAIGSISTNSAGAMGSCGANAAAMALSPREYHAAMAVLLRLSREYGSRITAQAGPLASARMWRRMETARRENAPPSPEGGALTGCGCVWERMAVQADGTMAPCPMLAHLALGRINHDDLGDTWRDSPVLSRLRARSSIPLARFAFCDNCPYTPWCTGNCPGLARALAQTDEHPSPDGCLRSYLAAGGTLVEEQ